MVLEVFFHLNDSMIILTLDNEEIKMKARKLITHGYTMNLVWALSSAFCYWIQAEGIHWGNTGIWWVFLSKDFAFKVWIVAACVGQYRRSLSLEGNSSALCWVIVFHNKPKRQVLCGQGFIWYQTSLDSTLQNFIASFYLRLEPQQLPGSLEH